MSNCPCTWPAQVASAIELVVQLTRYAEDGSRKVSRITECRRLDERDRFQFADLFVSHLTGRTAQGQLIAELLPTGEKPLFSKEAAEHGLQNQIRHSAGLWDR